MRSEIAWLMEAFLEEDYKKLRVMIKNRMAEVTEAMTAPQMGQLPRQITPNVASASLQDPIIATQSPSMQRIMAQNPELMPKVATPVTPAAAAALAAREALIMSAGKSKPEKGRKGPKKGLNI